MLDKSLKKIKQFLQNKYKENLAGILVFGSANTGNYKEGESDIDTLVFIKKVSQNREKDAEEIKNELKDLNISLHYIKSLEELSETKTWSSYVTICSKDGSLTIYSTKEFEQARNKLEKSAPKKEEIINYLKEKDKFELEGYINKDSDFKLTKDLMSHIRRKLQILSYFKIKALIFDFKKCLLNINLSKKEKQILSELYNKYQKREEIKNKRELFKIANKLTKLIEKI